MSHMDGGTASWLVFHRLEISRFEMNIKSPTHLSSLLFSLVSSLPPCVCLETEPRALCVLGKCSTPPLNHTSIFSCFHFAK